MTHPRFSRWRRPWRRPRAIHGAMITACVVGLTTGVGYSQQQAVRSVDLNAAVGLALENYPQIRESQARARAAQAGIDLARTAYLPRLDFLFQQNRATRNNVWGLLLPQSIIPIVSGPVQPSGSDGLWSAAAGFLLTWEPVDFGQRRAQIGLAEAERIRASAQTELTRLDVASRAADAVLAVVAAEQAVTAAEANVKRLEVFAQAVQVLVDNQLRPGADASRAIAELAEGRNGLIRAREVQALAQAGLAEAIGLAGTQVSIAPGRLLELPAPPAKPTPAVEGHPAAVADSALMKVARSRERVLARSYFPRINLVSTVSDRGISDSLLTDRLPETSVSNWAAGVSVTFLSLDFFALRARRRVETEIVQAEEARYERTLLELRAEEQAARARLDAARQVADNAPQQRKAAADTELQARARYEAGLTSIIEVAEAQRLLVRAEVEDALARVSVWRALLALAVVGGDIEPVLREALSSPERHP